MFLRLVATHVDVYQSLSSVTDNMVVRFTEYEQKS